MANRAPTSLADSWGGSRTWRSAGTKSCSWPPNSSARPTSAKGPRSAISRRVAGSRRKPTAGSCWITRSSAGRRTPSRRSWSSTWRRTGMGGPDGPRSVFCRSTAWYCRPLRARKPTSRHGCEAIPHDGGERGGLRGGPAAVGGGGGQWAVTMPPTFGSLFAGIGGLDLGLERAGWECRWQVENDPFCLRVLARHWPSVRRFGDIRTLAVDALDAVDLICGGFPCQPVSHAGKRQGTADARWLWPEFLRVVRVLRPGLVLVENVAGLLSVSRGNAMGEVLGGMAPSGYDAEWDRLPGARIGATCRRQCVLSIQHQGPSRAAGWLWTGAATAGRQHGAGDSCRPPNLHRAGRITRARSARRAVATIWRR